MDFTHVTFVNPFGIRGFWWWELLDIPKQMDYEIGASKHIWLGGSVHTFTQSFGWCFLTIITANLNMIDSHKHVDPVWCHGMPSSFKWIRTSSNLHFWWLHFKLRGPPKLCDFLQERQESPCQDSSRPVWGCGWAGREMSKCLRDQPMEIHGDRHGGKIWGETSHAMGSS